MAAAVAVVVVALCSSATAYVELPLNHFSIDGAVSDGVYIEIELGTPPTRAAVLLDTGSATLAVASSQVANAMSCPQCFGNEPAQFAVCPSSVTAAFLRDEENFAFSRNCVIGSYDYRLSTTAELLPATPNASNPFTVGEYACGTGNLTANTCGVGVIYGGMRCALQRGCGQGYIGVLGTDILSLGSSHICPTCPSNASGRVSMVMIDTIMAGFQEPPTAGIMGIGLTALNNNSLPYSDTDTSATAQPNALTTILNDSGLPDEFSFCMGNVSHPGVILLGGTDHKYYTGDFTDVPMVTQPFGYYGITVLHVGVPSTARSGYTIPNLPPNEVQAQIYVNGNERTPGFTIVDSFFLQHTPTTEIFNAINNSFIPCSTAADCTVAVTVSAGSAGQEFTLNVPGLMACDGVGAVDFGPTTRVCGYLNNYVSKGGGILGYAVLRNYYTVFRRGGASPSFGFATPTPACMQSRTTGVVYNGPGGRDTGASNPSSSDSDVWKWYYYMAIIAGGVVLCAVGTVTYVRCCRSNGNRGSKYQNAYSMYEENLIGGNGRDDSYAAGSIQA